MKRLAQGLALIAFTMFAGAGSAQAAIIDFGTGDAGNGGTITTAGGFWYGSGIPLNLMTTTGTSADDDYDLSGTGDGSNAGTDCCAVLNFNTETGAISVIGGVPSLSVPNGTALLSGTISSSNVTVVPVPGAPDFVAFSATGLDTKSPLLLTALGLNPNTQFAFFGFSIGLESTAPNTYFSTSTDITTQSIPEPGLLALFGLGLLGVGRHLAQRRRA